jgi:DNA-directed RNA polymerase subunit beta
MCVLTVVRKLYATILLRALGYSSEQMLEMFFETTSIKHDIDGYPA